MASRSIVEISLDGQPLARGAVTRIAGYRVSISVLNRKDPDFRQALDGLPGAEVGLVFRVGGDKTPPILGSVANVTEDPRFTVIEVEISDWGRVASYLQSAEHGVGRPRGGGQNAERS